MVTLVDTVVRATTGVTICEIMPPCRPYTGSKFTIVQVLLARVNLHCDRKRIAISAHAQTGMGISACACSDDVNPASRPGSIRGPARGIELYIIHSAE